MTRFLSALPLLPKFRSALAGVGSSISFLANLAEVSALAGAIYAFMYPASVARMAVDFEQLLIDARSDLGTIAEAMPEMLDNTGRTASNTQRIADAIPNWLIFEGPPLRRVVPSATPPYRYSTVLKNPSNFPVELAWTVHVDGRLVSTDRASVMPLELQSINWGARSKEKTIVICLSGTSDALQGTFYEKRIYGENKGIDRGFEPISGC